MRSRMLSLLALAALAVGCQGTSGDVGTGGGDGQFAVQVAALSELEIADACYELTATDGAGVEAWSVTFCGTDYGLGAQGLYIGPCQELGNDYTISLVLLSVSDAEGEIPPEQYVNPCPPEAPCLRTAVCEANADVRVHYDITLLTLGDGGWLDVTMDYCGLVCSAKLDCVDPLGEPLLLLPRTDEVRGTTLVLGLSCRRIKCAEPGFWQYQTPIAIECDEGTAVIDPSGPGIAPVAQTADLVYGAMVFDQTEGTPAYAWSKAVAIGWNGGTNCRLTSAATAACTQLPDLTIPEGIQHPAIRWDVPVTDEQGALSCTRHGLGGSPGGVEFYLPDAPYTWDYEYFRPLECSRPAICDPPCAPNQTCVDGVCVGSGTGLRFTLQWSMTTDIDIHVVTPGGAHVYYNNPTGGGCQLDVDNTQGGPGSVENIICRPENAGFQPGTYAYWVTNFTFQNGPADYTLSAFLDDVEIAGSPFVEVVYDTIPPASPEPISTDPTNRPASVERTVAYP